MTSTVEVQQPNSDAVVRLLEENNRLIKENNMLLKSIDEKLRKIVINTNGHR